jgi:hypothetical protein
MWVWVKYLTIGDKRLLRRGKVRLYTYADPQTTELIGEEIERGLDFVNACFQAKHGLEFYEALGILMGKSWQQVTVNRATIVDVLAKINALLQDSSISGVSRGEFKIIIEWLEKCVDHCTTTGQPIYLLAHQPEISAVLAKNLSYVPSRSNIPKPESKGIIAAKAGLKYFCVMAIFLLIMALIMNATQK